MDYERKYKLALERAQKMQENSNGMILKKWLRGVFPELVGSEDERIRKGLINGFKECLEDCQYPKNAVKYWHGVEVDSILAWLERQGENKPTDKVEPKFKIGDYVVGKYISGYISEIRNDCYLLDYQGFSIDKQDDYHLWTINDAKDGDVLAYATDEGDSWIMIYRSLYEPYEGHVHYHALLVNDNFSDKGTCCICIDNLKPATKEQRDLLFQKMKEAEYEWDSEKKELEKIKVKALDADKVIEWLKNTIREVEERLGEHGIYYNTQLVLPYNSIEDLINDFKEDFGL